MAMMKTEVFAALLVLFFAGSSVAGAEIDPNSAANHIAGNHVTSTNNNSNTSSELICYAYENAKDYSKVHDLPVREEPCSTYCYTEESIFVDPKTRNATVAYGGCAGTIENYCTTMFSTPPLSKYFENLFCMECDSDLCNPIISYSGAASGKPWRGMVSSSSLLLVLLMVVL